MEVWKDIKGYEGCYQVSNLGKIRSLDRLVNKKGGGKRLLKGRVLKTYIKKNGYEQIGLTVNGDTKYFTIHRLVAVHFIKNDDPDKNVINHKNGIKTDNKKTNLEWCTHSYNVKHSFDVLGYKAHNRKLTDDQVRYIRKHGVKGRKGIGVKDGNFKFLSEKFNVSRYTIEQIFNNKIYKDVI